MPIFHIIQGWTEEANQKLKNELLKINVPEKDIQFLTERRTRSALLNDAFKKVPQHYDKICLYDSDIMVDGSDFVTSLSDDLDKNKDAGCIIVPSYQFNKDEVPLELEPPMPFATEGYLRNVTFLTTFNIIMFRREVFRKGFKFDEEMWGSQCLDVVAGIELNMMGYHVLADLRHCLAHQQSDFYSKSLAYHGVVARNRHIIRVKFMDYDNWKGIEDYNKRHPEDRIWTVEEVTHAGEKELVQYICSYDKGGFNMYLDSRFRDLNSVAGYHTQMNEIRNKTPDKYRIIINQNGIGFGV